MTTNPSDIFQIPTELRREKLSFCQNTVKSVQEWSAGLSILQLGDSSKTLFNALLEISELQCQETLRFDLIQSIHPIIENILSSLEKHFFNQGLITNDRNEHIIELALLLRCYFAKIYIDIARRSNYQLNNNKFSFFAFNQKKNLHTARIVSSYYALQQLALLLYQQQIQYSAPLPGQWLTINQLMDCALQNHYDHTNINQLLGTQHQLQSVNQSYAQLILLEIFNTHQIRPSEIQGLYLCSFDWAKLVQVLPKETTLSRYIVDTSKDHPPIYNAHQSGNFQPGIYISTQDLLEHLNNAQGKNGEYLSRNEKLFLTPALHFHIHNLLTNSAERRHERYEYSAQLKICFGLTVAHFYLSKGKNFKETLELDAGNYQFQNESHFINSMSANIPVEMNTSRTLDRETKQIYSTEVLDISVNGYRIKWTGATPKNLKTGEFILVQENAQSQWRGGVIRWIKQSAEKSLELGLEMLAQDIYPCSIFVKSDRNHGNYHPALLVQTTQLDEVSSSLILPGLQMLRDKQTVMLRLGTEELKVYLVKPLLITQSFMRFDFELLNDQKQSVIDAYISKQASEIKNQDLWESLK
ncbi:GTPase [Acinetobacter sp. WCHAc010052]|uniref:GTPase n=1 Tax=Acinetobacter sp. WCHAc010052 TaxID=2004647 RepID=UPI000B3BF836|nr:GTPase [Acinetobacter sp. WCHAc010052]AXY59774.1 GTPase [Acinetobacter sp. WCHAc010052]